MLRVCSYATRHFGGKFGISGAEGEKRKEEEEKVVAAAEAEGRR